MGAAENVETAKAAYAAFSRGDAAGAMAPIDDGIEWRGAGDNAISGPFHGKEEVGAMWAQLATKGFTTQPRAFLADGDTVVVLTTVGVDGQNAEFADELTFNGDGRLVRFEVIGDPAIADAAFPR